MLVILLLLIILLLAWILAKLLGTESQAYAIGSAIRSLFVQAPVA